MSFLSGLSQTQRDTLLSTIQYCDVPKHIKFECGFPCSVKKSSVVNYSQLFSDTSGRTNLPSPSLLRNGDKIQFEEYRGIGTWYILWLKRGLVTNETGLLTEVVNECSFANALDVSNIIMRSGASIKGKISINKHPVVVPRDTNGSHNDSLHDCYMFVHPDESGECIASAMSTLHPNHYGGTKTDIKVIFDSLLVHSQSFHGQLLTESSSLIGCYSLVNGNVQEFEWIPLSRTKDINIPPSYFEAVRNVMSAHFSAMVVIASPPASRAPTRNLVDQRSESHLDAPENERSYRMICNDGKSSKFFHLTVQALTATVTFGVEGTSGQTTLKSFKTEEDLNRFIDRTLKERQRKGYHLPGDAATNEVMPASASRSSSQRRTFKGDGSSDLLFSFPESYSQAFDHSSSSSSCSSSSSSGLHLPSGTDSHQEIASCDLFPLADPLLLTVPAVPAVGPTAGTAAAGTTAAPSASVPKASAVVNLLDDGEASSEEEEDFRVLSARSRAKSQTPSTVSCSGAGTKMETLEKKRKIEEATSSTSNAVTVPSLKDESVLANPAPKAVPAESSSSSCCKSSAAKSTSTSASVSTDTTYYLTCTESQSYKFYQITVSGATLTVVYGKIGTEGISSTRILKSAEAALSVALRAVEEKTKKGYVLGSPPEAARMTARKPSFDPNLNADTNRTLLSGHKIPIIGFGAYQVPILMTEDVVLNALRVGYRQIDCARSYKNEVPCANAMRSSGLAREDLFFTSKVPPKVYYNHARTNVEATLEGTGLEYVDLYLLHAPFGGKDGRIGAWRALMEFKKAGKIRSIGVSNFGVHHLNELQEYIETFAGTADYKWARIDVGQWEIHPWLPREDIVTWAREHEVVIQAYSPLVRGKKSESAVLRKIGEKHGKTWAQVLLRWSLQKGYVPLPKSVTPSRIEENIDIFDFALDESDMAKLHFPDSYAPSGWDPTVSR